jgi:hypothetical protein
MASNQGCTELGVEVRRHPGLNLVQPEKYGVQPRKFPVQPGMDAVQNTLKAAHLRPDGVMIRMSAVAGWVCLKIPNHVGRRRWKGGNLVRLSPVHGEQGGVLRWNDGTDGEMERWRDGEMERWRDGEMEH